VAISGATIACAALGACATTVVPPADPANPATVYLLDHGLHSSLVLPGRDGVLVRYEYGDWAWTALNERGIGIAWRALFCPNQAALGRRELAPASPPASGRLQSVHVPIEHAYALSVDDDAVARLRAELDAIYEANIRTAITNSRYGLDFVHHPAPYTGRHNSNHVLADWLEALGCRINGPRWNARWVVK
jgi:hypothetical protein